MILAIDQNYIDGFKAATSQQSQRPKANGSQTVSQYVQAVSQWQEQLEDEAEKANGFVHQPGSPVAVQLITGYFSAGCSEEEEVFWGCFDTLRLIGMVDRVKAETGIKVLILCINSPGGSVQMVAESAAAIEQLKAERPDLTVLSFIDGMACSAACYISAAADEVHAVEGSYCGSIGTILTIPDSSEAYKMAGVKVHAIVDGKYKSLGTPGVEVTTDQLALMQEWVNSFSFDFKNFMRRNRPGLTDDDMQGQCFIASGNKYPPALIDNNSWKSFEQFAESVAARLSLAVQ